MITVNAEGLTCPLPVVKTKEAIQSLNGQADQIRTIVDNDIAVQNLTKFADQRGYKVETHQTSEHSFTVTMDIPGGDTQQNAPEQDAPIEPCDIPAAPRKKTIVVAFGSQHMGVGDDELGSILAKSFIFALTKQDQLPRTIIFYNSGAFITTQESAALDDLKTLADQGVRIVTCGTCLNHFGLTEQLKIGEVSNMYEIVELLVNADLVIKP